MTTTNTETSHAADPAQGPSASRRFWTWSAQHPTIFPAVLIVLTCLVVGAINTDFWQLANLFDILRASVVRGLFALGVLVVLASGGLDVSFTAIGALVMYTLTLFVVNVAPELGMAPILALAAVAGAGLGAINGLLVNVLKAPALIVTIGTQYAFRGFLLTFIGTALFMNIPAAMDGFGRLTLISVTTERGLAVELPVYFLVLVVAALLTWWMLNFTMIGRAIFAVGGKPDIAARLGYRVGRVRVFAFAFAGLLAGLAGVIHVTANRLANPFDLAGTELPVIAAVVLGGARITGGSGTVQGTLLGVLLITLVSNVLILVGIPSSWQTAILGGFILVAGLFFARLDKVRAT
ncbi:sugar ABC transporter permease [Salipiger pallidus]|uniref:Sugar ABC transporter permease n=1 Tax=Salipiger pallidus TaxID=1775170 RepID=A0A8J2ZN45_9RHOB|nr:ABC transporter permease [Salipiger pallidus]GGG85096.1 sugar ABC transporter permease [Salipiger pallidus]